MKMKYYSTNKQAPLASLQQAVIKGLAEDKGLYMPENITALDSHIISSMKNMNLQQIGNIIAQSFFGDSIEADVLNHIVNETLQFDIPLINLHDNIYSLELFHGPTLAFKDVGARFMARLLKYFIKKKE